MKNSLSFLVIVILISFSSNCKKETNNVSAFSMSSVTLVNAVLNSNPLVSDFEGYDSVSEYFSSAPTITYGGFYEFAVESGTRQGNIYQNSDSVHTLLSGYFSLNPNTIYSIFMSGTVDAQGSIDTLMTVDQPPFHSPADSTVGIRFVNLSPGSRPISVILGRNLNSPEVSDLQYLKITNFKKYSATADVTQYVFEIRDANSGSLLTNFIYNPFPFQNITVAIIGSENNNIAVPVSTIQINNF